MSETDICQNKHQENAQSMAAFNVVAKSIAKRRGEVLRIIKEAGEKGATVHEAAHLMDTHPNNISGRFTELKRDNIIEQKGKRPTPSGSNAGVYVIKTTPEGELNFDMFGDVYQGNPYEQ